MKSFKQFLQDNNACFEGRKFVGALTDSELQKENLSSQIECTVENTVNSIQRGDWLLWLAKKVDIDIKPLTLAKARCAKTVIHLMKDQRSIDAVNIAEKFGLTDEVTLDDLQIASKNADAAYADAATYAADAADAATYAADAAVDAAVDAAYAAADAYAAAAYAAAVDAKIKNQKQTADICREILGQLIIDKVNLLLAE